MSCINVYISHTHHIIGRNICYSVSVLRRPITQKRKQIYASGYGERGDMYGNRQTYVCPADVSECGRISRGMCAQLYPGCNGTGYPSIQPGTDPKCPFPPAAGHVTHVCIYSQYFTYCQGGCKHPLNSSLILILRGVCRDRAKLTK